MRRTFVLDSDFKIGKLRPFFYWRCHHDWAGGFRLGELFVRFGNNGRGVQPGRPGWLVDIKLTISTEKTSRPGS